MMTVHQYNDHEVWIDVEEVITGQIGSLRLTNEQFLQLKRMVNDFPDPLPRVTPQQIIELVSSLPDSELHIHAWKGKQCITSEWLVGNFAGAGLEDDNLEEAAQKLINYLYQHIGHASMVGRAVTDSGFPDMDKVREYCTEEEEAAS